eukprot:15476538-Alexandrium_andersonii.AAC.1
MEPNAARNSSAEASAQSARLAADTNARNFPHSTFRPHSSTSSFAFGVARSKEIFSQSDFDGSSK